MKNIMLLICLFLAACASGGKKTAPAQATAPVQTAAPEPAAVVKTPAPPPVDAIYCQRDLDNRVITIKERDSRVPAQSKEDFLCEVHYDKYGKSERVAWANGSKNHCDEVRGRIQTNLESAGFKCSKEAPKGGEKKAQILKKKVV
ncbi:MAG TPA: hypothetical protein VFV50_18245 [Bdellovibrionales bacterium]|nr:hypothetical protein [Bdellovibrionales bacterium]